MNRLLTILLLLAATAHGQINNPPTSVNIVDSTATGACGAYGDRCCGGGQ